MICYAKILDIDDAVEEAITISLGEITLVCFCSSIVKEIKVGEIYLCEIDLEYFDDEVLEEAKSNNARIERIGDSFAYTLYGYYNNGTIFLNGLYFCGEDLLDYGYLDNKFVKLNVCRINIDFLSN